MGRKWPDQVLMNPATTEGGLQATGVTIRELAYLLKTTCIADSLFTCSLHL